MLPEGEFAWLRIEGRKRTFGYRELPRYTRVELDLRSGRVMVDDPSKGARIDRVWSSEFDWTGNGPRGHLEPPNVVRLRHEKAILFHSFFQIIELESGGSRKEIKQVERYQGKQLIEVTEFEKGVARSRVEFKNIT